MPQLQCETCGSTAPGGRSSFPDVGLVCDACYGELYPKLAPAQKLSQQPVPGIPTPPVVKR